MSAMKQAIRPVVSTLRGVGARRSYITAARPLVQTRVITPTRLAFRYKAEISRSSFASNPIISYDELKPITEQPNDNVLLIDVRERDENALGSIPSAVNLPLSELKEALDPKFNEGEFQSKYAFRKPTTKQNIIFFCRSGKRSATAGEVAGEKGYHNVRNYQGSWLDWSSRQQKGASSSDDDD